jgi:DNA-binding NarL/FixJ family response regulator
MDRMPREKPLEQASAWLRGFRYAPRPVKFTPVQWLITQLIACGLSDKEIAHMLTISASTVKAHNNKTMRALGLMRRGQLVRYIFETGQFEPERAERMLAERKPRSSEATRLSLRAA